MVFWRLGCFSRGGVLATLCYLKELKDHEVNCKSFTEPYLDNLGPSGDVIVAMLATIATRDLGKMSENTKVALAKTAASVKLGTPDKSQEQIKQIRRLKGGGIPSYAIGNTVAISANTLAKYLNSS